MKMNSFDRKSLIPLISILILSTTLIAAGYFQSLYIEKANQKIQEATDKIHTYGEYIDNIEKIAAGTQQILLNDYARGSTTIANANKELEDLETEIAQISELDTVKSNLQELQETAYIVRHISNTIIDNVEHKNHFIENKVLLTKIQTLSDSLSIYEEVINRSLSIRIQSLREENEKTKTWAHAAYLLTAAIVSLLLIRRLALTVNSYLQDRNELIEINKRQENVVQASARLKSVGELSAGIAHEVNNPLTLINYVASQLLIESQKENPDREKLKVFSEKITKTSDKIQKIISSVKNASRDASQMPFENINLYNLINENIDLSRQKALEQNIHINIEKPTADILADCRPVEIGQVITNLIHNSIDAIEHNEQKWIKIKIDTDSNYAYIRVIDSGLGIPKEIQEKINQPYFSSKPAGKGTGIGLTFSKRIVESHNGSLTIDSQNPNTCFLVKIPVKQNHHPKSA